MYAAPLALVYESGPGRLHHNREPELASHLRCNLHAGRQPGLQQRYVVAGNEGMGDGGRLPPSAVSQCGSDHPLGSLAVNSGESRLAAGRLATPARVPTGMPKRTDRVFRQLVDRKISLAKL